MKDLKNVEILIKQKLKLGLSTSDIVKEIRDQCALSRQTIYKIVLSLKDRN